MSIPDVVNGSYEFLGGIAVWANVLALWRDKGYSGIRVSVMGFFTSWSLWNLYYYPHLNQWMSFYGGLSIGIANLMFIGSMLYFGRKK